MMGIPDQSVGSENRAHNKTTGADVVCLTSETGAWLAAVVESSDDAILSQTLDGTIMTWNAGAEKLFGYTADEAVGQPIAIIIPDDRLHEEELIIRELRAGNSVNHFETVRRRKDGSLVEISLTVSPVKDLTGTILGAAKIARDISTVKQAAARQDLVIQEMKHRIKNLFALATSLVALSARAARDVGELARDLTERLQALSRAHTLTLSELYEDVGTKVGSTLPALIREVLAPHDDEDHSRITIDGAPVLVGYRSLPTLGLLFHELATNATKYGALASPDGRLQVQIAVVDNAAQIRWEETGGPKRAENMPQSQGFGIRLEQASVGSLRGKLDRTWHDDGLDILMSFSLEQISC